MNFELNCSERNKRILIKLCEQMGHNIVEDSPYVITEKDFPIDYTKINVFFEDSNLTVLIDFLENYQQVADYLIGLKDGNSILIHFDHILYFYSLNNNVHCVTTTDTLKIKKKLYELETNFLDHRFTRINRSEIVNIYFIEKIIPWFNNRLLLTLKNSNIELEVSKNYVKNFKNALRM